MSKVSMPRPRYIAFRIEAAAPLQRRSVGNALRSASKGWAEGTAPQLTRYEWPHGIVRVEHTEQAAARKLLAGITVMEGAPVKVETLSASGTLKALTTRIGVLTKRTD